PAARRVHLYRAEVRFLSASLPGLTRQSTSQARSEPAWIPGSSPGMTILGGRKVLSGPSVCVRGRFLFVAFTVRQRRSPSPHSVIAGLDPAIHDASTEPDAWMAGSS